MHRGGTVLRGAGWLGSVGWGSSALPIAELTQAPNAPRPSSQAPLRGADRPAPGHGGVPRGLPAKASCWFGGGGLMTEAVMQAAAAAAAGVLDGTLPPACSSNSQRGDRSLLDCGEGSPLAMETAAGAPAAKNSQSADDTDRGFCWSSPDDDTCATSNRPQDPISVDFSGVEMVCDGPSLSQGDGSLAPALPRVVRRRHASELHPSP